jgi:hypothetical protein
MVTARLNSRYFSASKQKFRRIPYLRVGQNTLTFTAGPLARFEKTALLATVSDLSIIDRID